MKKRLWKYVLGAGMALLVACGVAVAVPQTAEAVALSNPSITPTFDGNTLTSITPSISWTREIGDTKSGTVSLYGVISTHNLSVSSYAGGRNSYGSRYTSIDAAINGTLGSSVGKALLAHAGVVGISYAYSQDYAGITYAFGERTISTSGLSNGTYYVYAFASESASLSDSGTVEYSFPIYKIGSFTLSSSSYSDTSGHTQNLHTHNWTYEGSGNTITATCKGSGTCSYTGTKQMTLSANGGTYSKSAYSASVSGSLPANDGSTISSSSALTYYTGTLASGGNYAMSLTPPTAAGTYTATTTVSGTNASMSKSFAISKASSSAAKSGINVIVTSPSYGTAVQTYRYDNALYDGTLKYTYSGTANDGTQISGSSTAPTKAGSYQLYWSGDATNNCDAVSGGPVSFTIGRATKSANDVANAITMSGGTYTGSALSAASVADGVNPEGGTVTWSYSGKDNAGNNYSSSEPPTNAGSYTVTCSIGQTDNYNATSGSKSFTIARADLPESYATTSMSKTSWTYGEEAATPTVTKESNPDSGSGKFVYYTDAACTSKTTTSNGADAAGGVPSNAGDYWVRYEYDQSCNYNADATNAVKFTINKKPITATARANGKTYDGTNTAEIEITIDDTSVVDVTVASAAGAATFSDANAGKNKVVTIDSDKITLSGAGSGNYTLSFSDTVKADIDPLEAQLEWVYDGNAEGNKSAAAGGTLYYDGSAQGMKIKVKNAIGDDTFNTTYTGTQKATGDGEYTVTIKDLGNANYVLSAADKSSLPSTTYTIAHKDFSQVTTPDGTKVTEATKPAETAQDTGWYTDEGGITLTAPDGYEIQITAPSKLVTGDWVSTIKITDSGDYSGDNAIKYILREKSTGYVADGTDGKGLTVEVKLDNEVSATKEDTVKTENIDQAANPSYENRSASDPTKDTTDSKDAGSYYKLDANGQLTIPIHASDDVSGLATDVDNNSTVQYMFVEETPDGSGGWTAGTAPTTETTSGWTTATLDSNGDGSVTLTGQVTGTGANARRGIRGRLYIKVTDAAGNTKIVESDRIVGYEDASAASAGNTAAADTSSGSGSGSGSGEEPGTGEDLVWYVKSSENDAGPNAEVKTPDGYEIFISEETVTTYNNDGTYVVTTTTYNADGTTQTNETTYAADGTETGATSNTGTNTDTTRGRWTTTAVTDKVDGKYKIKYYARQKRTGYVSPVKTVEFGIDTVSPHSPEIKVGEDTYDSILDTFDFTKQFKDSAGMTISANDTTSGIRRIRWQRRSKADAVTDTSQLLATLGDGTTANPGDGKYTWNDADFALDAETNKITANISVTDAGEWVVYALITDAAGNKTYVSSDGLVVYQVPVSGHSENKRDDNTGWGGVSIYNLAGSDGYKGAAGARFALYRADGSYVGTYTADASGYIHIPSIDAATYSLVMVSPAEGYAMDYTTYRFCVKDGQETVIAWRSFLSGTTADANAIAGTITAADQAANTDPAAMLANGINDAADNTGADAASGAGQGGAISDTADNSLMTTYVITAAMAALVLSGWYTTRRRQVQ